jgi:hypothetical protein
MVNPVSGLRSPVSGAGLRSPPSPPGPSHHPDAGAPRGVAGPRSTRPRPELPRYQPGGPPPALTVRVRILVLRIERPTTPSENAEDASGRQCRFQGLEARGVINPEGPDEESDAARARLTNTRSRCPRSPCERPQAGIERAA